MGRASRTFLIVAGVCSSLFAGAVSIYQLMGNVVLNSDALKIFGNVTGFIAFWLVYLFYIGAAVFSDASAWWLLGGIFVASIVAAIVGFITRWLAFPFVAFANRRRS